MSGLDREPRAACDPSRSAATLAQASSGGTPVRKPVRRVTELDGIRGWAALSVVCFHFVWETFGHAVPGVRTVATAGLMNGRIDVAVFFILSGDALSTPFFATGDYRSVIRSAAGRYLRLAIPVLPASALVFLLMTLGLVDNSGAAAVVHREDWLGHVLQFPPGLASMLRFALRDVFFFAASNVYLPFLWTMPIELLGSVAVFAILLAYDRLEHPARVVAGLAVVLTAFDVFLGCFLAGVLIGRWRSTGVLDTLRRRIGRRLGWALLGADYVLLCLTQQHHAAEPYLIAPLAFVTLMLIHTNRRLLWFFGEFRLSRLLGALSFPLYLVHFIVLVSLTSHMIVSARLSGVAAVDAAAISGIGILASLALAGLFLPVERIAHRASRWMGRLIAP